MIEFLNNFPIHYIFIGAFVGFAVGITGIGGGSLMTPILLFLGIPPHIAVGTDLLYAGITKSGGVISHQKLGHIKWRIVMLLAITSVPVSILTTLLLKPLFNEQGTAGSVIELFLGIMLLATGCFILVQKFILNQRDKNQEQSLLMIKSKSSAYTLLMGGMLGFVVTVTSVGAGAFCAALLFIIYPHLKGKHVVGTDIAHAVPLTLVAGISHALVLESIDYLLLVSLLIGSLPAIHFGSRVSSKIPEEVLRSILASILMVIGLLLLVRLVL